MAEDDLLDDQVLERVAEYFFGSQASASQFEVCPRRKWFEEGGRGSTRVLVS